MIHPDDPGFIRDDGFTLAVNDATLLLEGMQLRPRRFVPKRIGDFILWLFFHRLDTKTQVVVTR